MLHNNPTAAHIQAKQRSEHQHEKRNPFNNPFEVTVSFI